MISLTTLTISSIVVAIVISPSASDYPDHECKRECVTGTRMKCRYNFVITESYYSSNTICEDELNENCPEVSPKNALLINGDSLGPPIEVCLGDTIEVFLYNKLLTQEVSLHWHGLNSVPAHMDGVSMITQCPILPYSSFKYEFKPEKNGSYFYHAHLVSQQADGLYGPLIVRTPEDDLNYEKILTISTLPSSPLSWYPQPVELSPAFIFLNGKTNDQNLIVKRDHQYRLRLINANAFNCPVGFFITEHTFRIKSIGNNPVNLLKDVTHVIVFPGERIDILLMTNKPTGIYNVIFQGFQDCRDLVHEATLTYDDIKSDDAYTNDYSHLYLDTFGELPGHGCQNLGENVVCSLDLKGFENDEKIIQQPSAIYYIPFDVNYYGGITDDMTDYSFNIYGFSHYPSYLTARNIDGVRIAQVNRMTFKYPPSPILSQPEAVPENIMCSLEHTVQACESNPEFCECFQIVSVPAKQLVEVILIDEGKGGNVSQTFHVHGYSVNLVGFHQFERPITKEEIVSLDHQKLLHRNLMDPPMMDTFVVPNKGYVILRFYTNNIGYWLWEARSTGVSSTNGPPMQFLMRVGNRENMPIVPIDFPTCGNHKGPDLIFEDQ